MGPPHDQIDSNFFAKLPAEIRVMVYREVMANYSTPERRITPWTPNRVQRESLLLVCKRVHDEASAIIWEYRTLHYPGWPSEGHKWIEGLPPLSLAPYVVRLKMHIIALTTEYYGEVLVPRLAKLSNFIRSAQRLRVVHLQLPDATTFFSEREMQIRLDAFGVVKLPENVDLIVEVGKDRHPSATKHIIKALEGRIKCHRDVGHQDSRQAKHLTHDPAAIGGTSTSVSKQRATNHRSWSLAPRFF